MNEPIVFKQSVLIGQFVLVQLLAPPAIAIGMLYGLLLFYEVPFDAEFRILAVLIAILTPTVIRRPRVDSLAMLPKSWSIGASILLRWLLLLAILIAIGYVTKSSAQFSRRVILTWALVTPVPLILVSIVLHELIRRFMHSPQNARAAVIAGYNDVSLALAERVRNNREFGIVVKGFFDDRSTERLGLPKG